MAFFPEVGLSSHPSHPAAWVAITKSHTLGGLKNRCSFHRLEAYDQAVSRASVWRAPSSWLPGGHPLSMSPQVEREWIWDFFLLMCVSNPIRCPTPVASCKLPNSTPSEGGLQGMNFGGIQTVHTYPIPPLWQRL